LEPERAIVRVAAMSDVHYGKTSQGVLQRTFAELSERADVLALCGDLTDYGLAEEARLLAKDITASLKIPVVAVLGNHDYESNEQEEIVDVLRGAGVTVLDGDATEVRGVGFAGVKGFAGGFGRGALGPWGEAATKAFVHEAINEALKLESALARLRTVSRIAILHYAPICETVEGEPEQIWPYLGSSRLEEPLGRFEVTAVFHGHAHKGCPEGKTKTGVPVYNVALPLMRARFPDEPPYRLLEVEVEVTPHPSRRSTDVGPAGAALSPDGATRRRPTP
jgi:Icc-related predicted phosphoesterase